MLKSEKNIKEIVVEITRETGIIPCIKLEEKDDFISYAKAMYDGGARIVEVTSTTPGVIEAIESISSHFKEEQFWTQARLEK